MLYQAGLSRQVLRLSQTKLSTLTSGKVVNLVAGDSQRYEEIILKVFHVVLSSFEFCIVFSLTWCLLGYQALGGVVFMAFLVLYYGMMSRLSAGLRTKIARVTDRRLSGMNTIVTGIRQVKMHAWEWPFMEMVKQLRR